MVNQATVHPLKIDQIDHKADSQHPRVEMKLVEHPDDVFGPLAPEYLPDRDDTPRFIKPPKGQ